MTANNEGPPPKVPTPYDLWQETGDGLKLAPPYQDEQLWKVVERHFPEVTRETLVHNRVTAEVAVEMADNAIRDCCARSAVWDGRSFGEDGQPLISYGHKQSGSALLKQAIQAIDDRDLALWREAIALMPYNTKVLLRDTAERHGQGLRTLGDSAIITHGPSPLCVEEYPQLWNTQRSILKATLKRSSKGGRPSSDYRDDALREAVYLWSLLSGKTPTQPHYKTGSSERSGSMVEFVLDVIAVYDDYGMKGAISKHSGSSWTRIVNAPKTS